MCEPYHSVVQYPDQTDDDHNLPGYQMSMSDRLRVGLGDKVARLGKKIKSWFHFSKIGNGHTGAIDLSGKASLILPSHTRYEGDWWNRTFHRDGWFEGPQVNKEMALEVAEQYHNQTVMLNMKTFRRFLESSIENSSYAFQYVERLLDGVLTGEGRDEVMKRLRSSLGSRGKVSSFSSRGYGVIRDLFESNPENKVAATKVIMGITRQRKLFQSHWSDDNKFWAT